MCLDWGWYLQNDMQIFIYCIFTLMIFSYNQKAGKVMIWGSIIISTVYTFVMCQVNGYIQISHIEDLEHLDGQINNIYMMPWCRCPPYLLGLLLGMEYDKFNS